jgi:restriction system protein
MARSGSLAAWEQRLATQRREDDRQARQKRQAERDAERIQQQDHLAARQQEAVDKTAATQARMKELGEVLTSVLALRPLTFERLLAAPKTPGFDPGPLAAAGPGPQWKDYAPAPATGLSRFLGGGRQARLAAEQARTRFDAAGAEHQRQEAERRRALAAAKASYDRQVTEERAKTAARNAYVTQRQAAFAARDPEAVQWFAGCVLRASRYPDGFPRDYRVTYDPQARRLAVDLELPSRDAVPAERAYRYVKTRDAIEPVPRAENEITQAHERLVACVALRSLHELFGALPDDLVQAVALTGWVATTDRATGAPVRPRLLDLRAGRPVFAALVLDAVDPPACLTHLTTLAAPVIPPLPARPQPIPRSTSDR